MKKLLHLLTDTSSSKAALLLRLTLALVFFPHGLQKFLSFHETMAFFTAVIGIPYLFALIDIISGLLAPIALFFGFLTRIAAFALGFEMVIAILTVHTKYGFFMNWSGKQAGEGFEFHLLAIGITMALVITGAGKWSVDRWMANSTNKKK